MPRIITAASQGLKFQDLFGPLGDEYYVTGHWTAGVWDKSLSHARSLCRSYHRSHAAKGWGGIGYHFCVTRGGLILCLRPTYLKGAHVGGHNSNNIGVMFHGGYPTKSRPTMTTPQGNAFHWLLRNAHTDRMPRAHRTDRPLYKPHTKRLGHNDWSGHGSNACPGSYKREILHGGNL
jgi:hypothetical protein